MLDLDSDNTKTWIVPPIHTNTKTHTCINTGSKKLKLNHCEQIPAFVSLLPQSDRTESALIELVK